MPLAREGESWAWIAALTAGAAATIGLVYAAKKTSPAPVLVVPAAEIDAPITPSPPPPALPPPPAPPLSLPAS